MATDDLPWEGRDADFGDDEIGVAQSNILPEQRGPQLDLSGVSGIANLNGGVDVARVQYDDSYWTRKQALIEHFAWRQMWGGRAQGVDRIMWPRAQKARGFWARDKS